MSNICRLCLTFCTQNMWPLNDCDGVVYNSASFSMHISPNKLFPSHVCSICINKLNEFNSFYLQIKENQAILAKELDKGGDALNNFYKNIKNPIKKEKNELIKENQRDTTDNAKGNEIILQEIKTEEDLNMECGVDFNSEDELPLSEIKSTNIEETLNKETNVETDNKCIDAAKTNTHNNFTFKCLTCFEAFFSQYNLLNHYNNVHKSKKEAKVNNYTLVDRDEKTLYKCNNCNKTYEDVRAVNKHAQTHCDENFHCRVCGRTYKTVSEIIRHGRAHDGTKLSCSFGCGFSTVYSGALQSHERRHRADFKYKCDTCGKSFQVKTWYEQHQNVHTGAKPYVCDICGMTFHMDRYLKAHRSNVHPEASTRKRYICVKCSKPCSSMIALTRHLKEHGITSSLLCDLCGKTLCSTEQLKIHRRLHMGVKPYSCSTCDKSFAKRSTLKLHQITHSGERAHACSACGKQYTQRSTLLRHVYRHHSATTIKCPKCDTTLSNQAELRAHQKLCAS